MEAITRIPEASAVAKTGLRLLSLGKEATKTREGMHTKLLEQDGGGVRGLSALLILEHLMQGLNPETPPKPCEVFDLIGGTSTGGLIAIMLGRLKMDVSSCIDAYLDISSSAFKPSRNKINLLGRFADKIRARSKFSSKELEKVFKEVVRLELGDEDARFREDDNPECRVFVCAIRKDNNTLARLRSYTATRDVATVEDCKIWEAGRATSAAAMIFDPIVIGKYGESFIDGATGSNNPVLHVVDEARRIWTNEMNIHCLISIGTGNPSLTAFGTNLRDIAQTLVKISTETEKTEEEFLRANSTLLKQNRYFRFNVAHGLEKIGLEHHRMKPSIAASTTHYLGLERTQEEVVSCLGTLTIQSSDQLPLGEIEGRDTTVEDFARLSKDERKCLASFALADYRTYRARVSKRHPGTLEWFLEHELYKNWVSTKSSLLWVTGNPGCGKTVLSAFLLDQLEMSVSDIRARVVYFFCDDKYDSQKTAEALLRGVIHQLLTAIPRLIKHAMPKFYTEGTNMFTSLDRLWSVFLDIVSDPITGGIYCVLDALDECEETSREDLLGRLAKHFQSAGNSGRKSYLNVILTSRPYETIQNFLHRFSIIRLRIEGEEKNINQDIATFLSYEVEQLAEKRGYNDQLKADVKRALEGGADGMFLWISLIIKDLEMTPTDLVAESLKSLPQDLDALYLNLLTKLAKRTIRYAKRILQFVVTALEPLSLTELAIVCNIRPDDTRMTCYDKSFLKTFERNIALCGPILKVQDRAVTLVHQSAKDFLINPELQDDFRISSLEANHQFAAICLIYLSFDEFEEGPLEGEDKFDVEPVFIERLQKFQFLPYAGKHWPEHVRQAEPESIDLWSKFSKLAQSSPKLQLAYQTFRFLKNEPFKVTEPLQILAHFDIPFFLDNLLDRGADINAQGGQYGNALQAAVQGGNEVGVKLLLDRGADVNAQGGRYKNALQAAVAVSKSMEPVVKLLLDRGADVNAQGGEYGNALQAAAAVYKSTGAVVKLLLDRGANINAQGGEFGNAVQAAARYGNEEMVKLLLDRGADVNTQGGEYGNALQSAALNGNEAVVKLLLDRGADFNAQGGKYGNALQVAALEGNESMVKLLLDRGADVNAQGGKYGNALQAAALDGNEAAVKLLLDNGADVNAQGGGYGNALQAAVRNGNEAVVKLLLDRGADINAQGGEYGNALLAAARDGNNTLESEYNTIEAAARDENESMVRLLLDRGADINAQGGEYGSALQAATLDDNEMMVKLLLGRGADVNAQGGIYTNPLQAAVSNNNETVVKLLLDNGADINAKGGRHGNVLQLAALDGNSREAMVKLLLANGADVNTQGGGYGNALQAAAYDGSEVVVKLLLDKGADINAQGGEHGNALQAAVLNGNETVVKVLLDKGAYINAQGGEYGNALQAAVWGSNETVVKLLLDNGADINAQGGEYGNALQAAAVQAAASNGSKAMVKLLLDNGAHVNAQGGKYGNALHAIVERSWRLTPEMQKSDQLMTARGETSETFKSFIDRKNKDSEGVVRLLLERGADIDENTLDAARKLELQHLVQLLQEYATSRSSISNGLSAKRVTRAASICKLKIHPQLPISSTILPIPLLNRVFQSIFKWSADIVILLRNANFQNTINRDTIQVIWKRRISSLSVEDKRKVK